MRTLLHRLFIEHWKRKLISIGLAVVIWMIVDHTLTSTKVFMQVPIKVANLPHHKTIEGISSQGVLSKKITLTLSGNKGALDQLSPGDIEVQLDATNKPDEWHVVITKKDLISLNTDIDLKRALSRVSYAPLTIHLTKQITEKIPIVITQPIGDAPRDYLYLDVWPYHLTLTVKGPEEVVKRIKSTGQKLTFNLNNISKAQLDALTETKDEVSFYVPDEWKQIELPALSDAPFDIDDPEAKLLRIDFIRCNFLSIDSSLPVSLFFPPEFRSILNPENCSLASGGMIVSQDGLTMISTPLYAKGVSQLFLEIVKENLEITVIAAPKNLQPLMNWSVQFIDPHRLEDRYVSTLLSDISDEETRDLPPTLREEYLRNRFRSYMNRFQLYKADQTPLELDISLEGETVSIHDHAP